MLFAVLSGHKKKQPYGCLRGNTPLKWKTRNRWKTAHQQPAQQPATERRFTHQFIRVSHYIPRIKINTSTTFILYSFNQSFTKIINLPNIGYYLFHGIHLRTSTDSPNQIIIRYIHGLPYLQTIHCFGQFVFRANFIPVQIFKQICCKVWFRFPHSHALRQWDHLLSISLDSNLLLVFLLHRPDLKSHDAFAFCM